MPASAIRRVAIAVLAGSLCLLALATWLWPAGPGAPLDWPATVTVGFSLLALASCAAIVLVLDPTTPVARLLQAPPLKYLGRLSYGVYFFHEIVLQTLFIFLFHQRPERFSLCALLAMPLTIALAAFSFRVLGSPFLRLKSRLAPKTA